MITEQYIAAILRYLLCQYNYVWLTLQVEYYKRGDYEGINDIYIELAVRVIEKQKPTCVQLESNPVKETIVCVYKIVNFRTKTVI